MSDLPVWVQWVGELGIPTIALGAALVTWASYRQRRAADRKAEWWRRAQYALDLMMEHRNVVRLNTGMELVNSLLDDPTATQEDAKMLAQVVDTAITMMVTPEPRRHRRENPGKPE